MFEKIIYTQLSELMATIRMRSVNNMPFFPYTCSALNMRSIEVILNDITINRINKVVELGAGLSTVYIAWLKKKSNLSFDFFVVEHDQDWVKILQEFIESNFGKNLITFITTPLKNNEVDGYIFDWYDHQILKQHKLNFVDSLLIDGPPAYTKEIEFSRYGAIPFFNSLLAEEYFILLDDTNRRAEKNIMRLWKNKYGIEFRKLTNKSKISIKGNIFNIL